MKDWYVEWADPISGGTFRAGRASPQKNKAAAASDGAGFKAADLGAGLSASDSLSRGLPNNSAGDAPLPQGCEPK